MLSEGFMIVQLWPSRLHILGRITRVHSIVRLLIRLVIHVRLDENSSIQSLECNASSLQLGTPGMYAAVLEILHLS